MSDMDEIRGELDAIRKLLEEIKTQIAAGSGSAPVTLSPGTWFVVPSPALGADGGRNVRDLLQHGAGYFVISEVHPPRGGG